MSDCLIGVSQFTVDDLVRIGIAPREEFTVVPLGLDLGRFARVTEADGADFRKHADAAPNDILLTCVCRVVPHKRVDLPGSGPSPASEIPTPASAWPSSATASTVQHWNASPASSA